MMDEARKEKLVTQEDAALEHAWGSVTLSRRQALKLVGAAMVGGMLSMSFFADEADAAPRRGRRFVTRRRFRRFRRRQQRRAAAE